MSDLLMLFFDNKAYQIFCIVVIIIAVILAICAFAMRMFLSGICVLLLAAFIIIIIPIIWWLFAAICALAILMYCIAFLDP